MCKPILVFSLSLGQAEQHAGAELGHGQLKLEVCKCQVTKIKLQVSVCKQEFVRMMQPKI